MDKPQAVQSTHDEERDLEVRASGQNHVRLVLAYRRPSQSQIPKQTRDAVPRRSVSVNDVLVRKQVGCIYRALRHEPMVEVPPRLLESEQLQQMATTARDQQDSLDGLAVRLGDFLAASDEAGPLKSLSML